MKKIFELLIFLLLLSLAILIMSCGTRKTDTQQRDSIHIENNYSEGSKIVLGNSFTYVPFDAKEPMQLGGVVYRNVIIKNEKSKTIEKWKSRYITKTITIEKTKKTIRKDNTWLFLGIIFIVILFSFLWFYLPHFKE